MPTKNFQEPWPLGELRGVAETRLRAQVDEYYATHPNERRIRQLVETVCMNDAHEGRVLQEMVTYEDIPPPPQPALPEGVVILPDTPEFLEKIQ